MNQMQRYREAKAKHPGMIVMFRLDGFYELFGEDAKTAAGILGLCLTQKTESDTGEKLFMAGFPHHSLANYLHRLLRAGQRVAICDGVEPSPPAKTAEKIQATLFDAAEE